MMKQLICFLITMLICCGCGKTAHKTEVETTQETALQTSKDTGVKVIHLMNRPAPIDTLEVYDTNSRLHYFLSSECGLDNDWQSERSVVCHSPLPDSLPWTDHPFIDGVRYAYANHHPMVINPDVVWLTIEQGFALHVKHHAEELRYLFVDHKGQMELRLLCEQGLINMPYEAWEPYFPIFSDSIAVWTKDSIAQILVADFSTTTPITLVASQIGLMSTMESYFLYVLDEGCGIPDIYLEGTAEDWRHLIDKTNRLRRYGLGWWVDELEPLLVKIAESAEGNVDLNFWRSIYGNAPVKVTLRELADLTSRDMADLTVDEIKELEEEYFMGGCGFGPASDTIRGWITAFYPYYSTAYTPEKARIDHNGFTDATINDLPLSHSIVPLKYVEFPSGHEIPLMLHAGLFGFTEDSVTRAIRPLIGWMISRKQASEEAVDD